MSRKARYYILLLLCCALAAGAQEPQGRLSSGMRRVLDTGAIRKLIDSAVRLSLTDPGAALGLLSETQAQSEWQAYHTGTGRSLLEAGVIYTTQGLDEKAVPLLRQAKPLLAGTAEGRRYVPEVIATQGRIHAARAEYETAIKYFYESIATAAKIAPEANLGYVYCNLAGVLTQIGRTPESVRTYLDKAEQSALQYKDSALLARVYNNRGFASNTLKTWDSSRLYFNQSLAIARAKKLPVYEHLALTNIGITYLEQARPQQALPYLEAANNMTATLPGYSVNLAQGALGQAYVLLGDYARAEPILLRQYDEAVAQQQPGNIRTAHYYLAQLYGARKDYDKAYRHAIAYIDLNNSLSGAEIIKHVNEEEVKFRTAEKDRDLLLKKLQIERQQKDLERKNRWITITVAIVVIVLLLVFFTIKGYRSRQRLMKQKMDNLEQQREIERLKADTEGEERERARIARELHDGIGGLVAAAQINMRTLGKEVGIVQESETYRSTRQILEEVGSELRKTAHNLMPSVLLHRNMEEAISVFCNYIRQTQRLHFDLQCYGDFNLLPDSYKVTVYRIVQELIHNVVKHAQASSVLVQLMFQQPLLSITIEDNGKGFEPDPANPKKGLGLKNIEERVQSIRGSFSIDSTPGKGTSVYIELDIPAGMPETKRGKDKSGPVSLNNLHEKD